MSHYHILHHVFIVFIHFKNVYTGYCSVHTQADMCGGMCLLSFYCCFDQQDSEEEETDVDMALNLDRGPQEHSNFQAYVPEDFANFEIYNATLESQEGFLSSHSDFKRSRCGGGSGERDLSRSPTASSCTSGYFSHSASNATLSDLPFSASESSDHLSCTPRDLQEPPGCPAGRGCFQTKSVSAGSDTLVTPCRNTAPAPSAGVQHQLIHHQTLPVSIPNYTATDQTFPLPHNCVLSTSQEFTDFKGADDSIGESDLAHFTQDWVQEGLELSTDQQRKAQHIETFDTGNQCSSDMAGIINLSNSENATTALCKCPNNKESVGVPVSCPNTAVVCTSIRAPDQAPSPVLIIPSVSVPPQVPPSSITTSSIAPSSAPALRAGGEPLVQEPAQGDLPHGSPCPSPNPSSAEPSGDSSGDESTPVAQLPDWMAPGEQVWVGKRRGTVHYVGGVEFAKGIWIGVKLDMAVGESLEGIDPNTYILFFMITV